LRKEGVTGVCADDDERFAAGVSREEIKAERGGSANATGIGARHGLAVKAILVVVKVRCTWTPTPTWCVYSDTPTPAPLSLVFW
jgi:hypothetical protein